MYYSLSSTFSSRLSASPIDISYQNSIFEYWGSIDIEGWAAGKTKFTTVVT